MGLYHHAAQPISRGLAGSPKGVPTEPAAGDGLDRLGLSIEANDIAVYRHIVDLVRRELRIDQTILAMPVNPVRELINGKFGLSLTNRDDAQLSASMCNQNDVTRGARNGQSWRFDMG